jgi:hypothetical protein
MAAFIDLCRFLATAGGTTDWVYSSAVGGCQSPVAAGAVAGQKYKVYACSADLTQWEISEGVYATTGGGTFPRTTVLYNSAGTGTAAGQTGAGTKISFAAAPNVSVVALFEDIARAPNQWTRTVLTSGSGTYTTKTGCTAINVRMVGGGGGGGGGGAGGGTGTAGGNTTFSTMTANGGAPGGTGGSAGVSGGTATGGDINSQGGSGQTSTGAGASSSLYQGAQGGASFFGGGGYGGWPGSPGQAGSSVGSGGGGGGASTAGGAATAGAAGGYCEKLITSPAASYSYNVGGTGGGGSAGTSGAAGGNGAPGIIIIDEYY